MLRAMYTSISGLRNHQTMLDVVGNNIANVNTYGFKASNTAFKTLLSQTTQGAGAPSANLGGTNNVQVGLGMTLDSIRQNFTQGALQGTGVTTDLAIQGDGFFQTASDSAAIAAVPSTATIEYTRAGNFTFDSNGTLVTSDGNFVLGWADDDPTLVPVDPLDPTGPTYNPFNLDTSNDPLTITMPTGFHTPIISQDGSVSAIDTNGNRVVFAQLSMSRFPNASGLTQVGNNRWQESLNSGTPVTDVAGASGIGRIASGNLEMSNVDLATEFTEMIKAQRGFQANSRTITTADEILQELVNLKR